MIGPVHVLDIALSQMLHQQRATVGLLLCQQQVHVIGHETADLDRARQLRGQGLKVCEIEFAPPVPRMSAARCRTDKRDPDIAFSVHAERGTEAAHPGLHLLC